VAAYLSRAGLTQNKVVDDMIISTDSGAKTFQGKLMGDGLALPKQASIKRIIEGNELRNFFESLLGGEVLTYDYKWLRTVKPGESSGAHMDSVYMGLCSSVSHREQAWQWSCLHVLDSVYGRPSHSWRPGCV